MKFTEKIFGTHSQRELKRIYPIVDKIEALRPTMQAMSDTELRDQTRKFRERLEARGIPATIRRELGDDIDGACGQLRRSTMSKKIKGK